MNKIKIKIKKTNSGEAVKRKYVYYLIPLGEDRYQACKRDNNIYSKLK